MMRALRRRVANQRGAVLAAVIVCLIIVMLLSGALVRLLTIQHRQHSIEQRRLQAATLAESGVDRALSRLRADAGYTGENWIATVDSSVGADGLVEIQVEAVAEPNGRRIIVAARWPDQPVHSVLERRETTINLPGDTE